MSGAKATRIIPTTFTADVKQPLYTYGRSHLRSSGAGEVIFADSDNVLKNSSWPTESLSEIKKLISEISSLLVECSEAGWDGYDSLPITAESVDLALKFIQSIPNTIKSPEIIPETGGKVGIQWEGISSSLILSCNFDSTITFGYYNSFGEETFGKVSFLDSLPSKLRVYLDEFSG